MCTLLARFTNICLLLTSGFDSFEGKNIIDTNELSAHEVIVIGLRVDGAAQGKPSD